MMDFAPRIWLAKRLGRGVKSFPPHQVCHQAVKPQELPMLPSWQPMNVAWKPHEEYGGILHREQELIWVWWKILGILGHEQNKCMTASSWIPQSMHRLARWKPDFARLFWTWILSCKVEYTSAYRRSWFPVFTYFGLIQNSQKCILIWPLKRNKNEGD